MNDALDVVLAVAAVSVAAAGVGLTLIQFFGERRRRRLEDRQVALAIHADLTSLEVQEARSRAATSPPHHAYLFGLYRRSASRYALLNEVGANGAFFESEMDEQISSLGHLVDPDGTDPATDVIEVKRSGGDRSRYTWDGDGRLTKHQVLQRIAARFAAERGLTERAPFLAAFSDELRQVRPDDPFDAAKVLAVVADADASHQSVANEAGALVLDGREHVVRHTLGYPSTDYGRRTQAPVIEHFRTQGHPVARVEG